MRSPGEMKLLLTACAVVFVLHSVQAADNYPGKPLKSTTKAVFLSMAIPGGGHAYTENYWCAAAFALAQGSFIASISWAHDRMEGAKKATPDLYYSQTDLDALERHFRNQRNRNIWWLVGVTLMSMGDAYVDAHLYGLDWSPEISPDDGGLRTGLTAAVRF